MTHFLITAALFAAVLIGFLASVSHAIRADTFGLDRGLAAMFFHAKAGETISLVVARWQEAGITAGCRWCRFLDIAVERGHCAKQLDPNSPATPLMSGLRAGVCLTALYVVPTLALVGLWFGCGDLVRLF